MKTPRISEAFGNIPEDLVSEAVTYKRLNKKKSFIMWGSIAACFAVFVIAGALILPLIFGSGSTPGGTNGKYKDYIQSGESGIIWSWEYQTVYEKYTELELDGIKYLSKGRAVANELVAESIGSHTVVGYDEMSGKRYTEDFEVYELKYADKDQFVAVKMEGKYYTFKKDVYAPPSTLGELLDLVDLPKAIELKRFSENGDDKDKKYYALNNDDYVWEVLTNSSDAAFVKNDQWSVHDKEYLSFTVTSETLGVYKVAMYVTKDGYLWTNAFNYKYLFDIGEDAANKIIAYAMENSIEAEYEPYQNTVAGEIVEITDEYILLDDTVLCNDPADGVTYKILLNDLRISRYVDRQVIENGDTVQIVFEGDVGAENIIDTAVSASQVTISDGDVLIPE